MRDGNWMLKHSRDNSAKTYFISAALQPDVWLFVLAPQTGKTHQIRMALRSQQASILGDERQGRALIFTCLEAVFCVGVNFQFECWPSCGAYFNAENVQTLARQLEAKLPEEV